MRLLSPVNSAERRSRDRYRRIALSAGASAVVRVLSLGCTFVSIPIVLRHLGTERFGLWVTITSLVALLSFSDLGVASGLVNKIAHSYGDDNEDVATDYVSSAFFTLLAVACGLGALFALAYPLISWPDVFNVQSRAATRETGPAMIAFFLCFLGTMPFGLAQRVHIGYQEGFVASLWFGLGSLLSLAAVLIAVNFDAGLPQLVLAVGMGPLLAALLNSVVLFGFRRRSLRPKLSRFTLPAAKAVLSTGLLFFTLGIAGAVGYHSDNIVIASIMGADRVPEFAIPMKLFAVVPMFVSLVLTPLWPAYGEAIRRGELTWVRTALKRSLYLGAIITVPSVAALTALAPQLIEIWVGSEAPQPTGLILVGLGIWALLSCVLGPFAMLFNGANVISFQVRWVTLMAIFNLLFSIVLVHRVGVSGAILGTVTAQILFLVIPYSLRLRTLFHSLAQQSEGRLIQADQV